MVGQKIEILKQQCNFQLHHYKVGDFNELIITQ